MNNLKDQPTEELERRLQLIQAELRKRKYEGEKSADNAIVSLPGAPCRQTARELLCDIFSAYSSIYGLPSDEDYQFPVDQALFLFRSYTSLVTEAFYKRTALSYFFQARADQSVIKELCAMYHSYIPWKPTLKEMQGPIDWKKHSEENKPPLDWIYAFQREPNIIADACLYGAAEGVMKLLIEYFPNQLLRKYKRFGPLDLLLSRATGQELHYGYLDPIDEDDEDILAEPSLEELRDMIGAALSYCPEVLLHCSGTNACVRSSLEHDSEGSDSQRFLFSMFAKHPTNFHCLELERLPILDMAHVLALKPLIPKLTNLYATPDDVASETYQALLRSIEEGKPDLYHLELWMRSDILREGSDLMLKLGESSPNLENLNLVFSPDLWDDDTDHEDFWLRCRSIIRNCPSVERLNLRRPQFFHPNTVCELLSSLTTLESLELHHPQLADGQISLNDFGSDCTIQEISIVADFTIGGWGTFLPLLRHLPHLEDMELCQCLHSGEPDMTETLVELLNANKVRRFKATRCRIQTGLEALATNTSLEELELSTRRVEMRATLAHALQKGNATLRKVVDWTVDPTIANDKLDVLLLLNRCGRAKLQDCNKACLAGLVGSLCCSSRHYSAGNPCNQRPRVEEKYCLLVHNVQYELLQLDPSIWSCVNPCKRKRL